MDFGAGRDTVVRRSTKHRNGARSVELAQSLSARSLHHVADLPPGLHPLLSLPERVQYGLETSEMKTPPKPKDVDAYIAAAPKEVRDKLDTLRSVIKNAAPAEVERISYGMPYYHYKGRLAYFAAFKKHIGLYLPTPTIELHKHELKDFETTKATVRLPLDKKPPIALIKKLIKSRMKANEAKQ